MSEPCRYFIDRLLVHIERKFEPWSDMELLAFSLDPSVRCSTDPDLIAILKQADRVLRQYLPPPTPSNDNPISSNGDQSATTQSKIRQRLLPVLETRLTNTDEVSDWISRKPNPVGNDPRFLETSTFLLSSSFRNCYKSVMYSRISIHFRAPILHHEKHVHASSRCTGSRESKYGTHLCRLQPFKRSSASRI